MVDRMLTHIKRFLTWRQRVSYGRSSSFKVHLNSVKFTVVSKTLAFWRLVVNVEMLVAIRAYSFSATNLGLYCKLQSWPQMTFNIDIFNGKISILLLLVLLKEKYYSVDIWSCQLNKSWNCIIKYLHNFNL